MKKPGKISETAFGAMTLGIALLLIAGLFGSQCGRSTAPTVIVVDTVAVKTDSVKHRKKPVKSPRKKARKPQSTTPRSEPASRDYRDEKVN